MASSSGDSTVPKVLIQATLVVEETYLQSFSSSKARGGDQPSKLVILETHQLHRGDMRHQQPFPSVRHRYKWHSKAVKSMPEQKPLSVGHDVLWDRVVSL